MMEDTVVKSIEGHYRIYLDWEILRTLRITLVKEELETWRTLQRILYAGMLWHRGIDSAMPPMDQD